MVAGLPAEYIKRHNGNMKAAWKEYRADTAAKGAHHRRAPAVREVTDQKSAALRATVQFQTQKNVDPVAIGYLLYGLLTEAQSPTTGELQRYFPPGSTGDPVVGDTTTAIWRQGDDEREIGREMARALGFGLTELRITQQQWNAMYARAMALIAGNAGGARSMGGLLPPLQSPSAVTRPFGVADAGRLHRGVDMQAAVGTPVVAPSNALVLASDTEDAGGQYVTLGLQRPDGGYAGQTSASDDSGLLVTYAHLSKRGVNVGDIVVAGQVVGETGNTGTQTSGPHLHVATEYFADAPFFSLDTNARYFVDPAGVWGGTDELVGAAVPEFPRPGAAIAAFFEDRSTGQQGGFVVNVQNSGTMQVVGQGAAINANARVLFPLGELGGGSGDASGYSPVPDAIRQEAQGFGATSVLTGIGSLANQFFGVVQGIGGPVLRTLGTVAPVVVGAVTAANQLLGVAAGPVSQVAGAAVTVASPFLGFVNPGLGAAAGVIGPIVGGIGTILGVGAPVAAAGLNGAINGVAGSVGIAPTQFGMPFGGSGNGGVIGGVNAAANALLGAMTPSAQPVAAPVSSSNVSGPYQGPNL